MIYSKDINTIEWNDVVEFCNQRVQENATLDYKKNFPNNLQKTIAAFANTMGGIILIGIDEDDENKPKLPIDGIPFERGISERIMNIILTNISPPIIPEIQICVNGEKSKAVALIRIPQSNKTPHAINKNTEVYVRTGNRSDFEPRANVDKLFWLMDNRKESVDLRESLYQKANDRFYKFYAHPKNQVNKTQGNNSFERLCKLTLILSTFYPEEIFCTPPEMNKVLSKIFIKDYFGTSEEFPITNSRFNSVMNQIGISTGLFIDNHAYFTELNCFGTYYYTKFLFGKPIQNEDKLVYSLRFNEIVARLDQFIKSANMFFTELGFNGLLHFSFSIEGMNGFSLRVNNDNYSTLENKVYYEESFIKNQLSYEKKILMLHAIRNLAWAYNLDMDMSYFNYFEKEFGAL